MKSKFRPPEKFVQIKSGPGGYRNWKSFGKSDLLSRPPSRPPADPAGSPTPPPSMHPHLPNLSTYTLYTININAPRVSSSGKKKQNAQRWLQLDEFAIPCSATFVNSNN